MARALELCLGAMQTSGLEPTAASALLSVCRHAGAAVLRAGAAAGGAGLWAALAHPATPPAGASAAAECTEARLAAWSCHKASALHAVPWIQLEDTPRDAFMNAIL